MREFIIFNRMTFIALLLCIVCGMLAFINPTFLVMVLVYFAIVVADLTLLVSRWALKRKEEKRDD